MSERVSYRDDAGFCFANVRLRSGEPCFISLTKRQEILTGLLVKRSRSGWLGKKLFQCNDHGPLDLWLEALESRGYSTEVSGKPPFTTPELAILINAALAAEAADDLALMFEELANAI